MNYKTDFRLIDKKIQCLNIENTDNDNQIYICDNLKQFKKYLTTDNELIIVEKFIDFMFKNDLEIIFDNFYKFIFYLVNSIAVKINEGVDDEILNRYVLALFLISSNKKIRIFLFNCETIDVLFNVCKFYNNLSLFYALKTLLNIADETKELLREKIELLIDICNNNENHQITGTCFEIISLIIYQNEEYGHKVVDMFLSKLNNGNCFEKIKILSSLKNLLICSKNCFNELISFGIHKIFIKKLFSVITDEVNDSLDALYFISQTEQIKEISNQETIYGINVVLHSKIRRQLSLSFLILSNLFQYSSSVITYLSSTEIIPIICDSLSDTSEFQIKIDSSYAISNLILRSNEEIVLYIYERNVIRTLIDNLSVSPEKYINRILEALLFIVSAFPNFIKTYIPALSEYIQSTVKDTLNVSLQTAAKLDDLIANLRSIVV